MGGVLGDMGDATPQLRSLGTGHPMARDTGEMAPHGWGPGGQVTPCPGTLGTSPHGWGPGDVTPRPGTLGTRHPIRGVLGDTGDISPHGQGPGIMGDLSPRRQSFGGRATPWLGFGGTWGTCHPVGGVLGGIGDMPPHGWGLGGHGGRATQWLGLWGTCQPVGGVLGAMGDVPPHG